MPDLVDTAIKRLQTASEMSLKIYEKPLIITTSGGKDSSVCVKLAKLSKIPFEVQHNHTTADAPETVYFVRSEFQRLELGGVKCTINYPYYKGERTSMWELIELYKYPPTRIQRYCCAVLKETAGKERFIATGVRWDESYRRKNTRTVYETSVQNKKNRIMLNNDNDEKRMLFETCQLKAKRIVNPIIDWTEDDVWDFLHDRKVPVNPLYCEQSRVGCIGCPMIGKNREKQFERWPKYKDMYMRAFAKMLEVRKERGKETTWNTAHEVFNWWMEYDIIPGQINFDEFFEDNEE